MATNNNTQDFDERSNEKMSRRNITIGDTLWEQAKTKAGLMPLSAVIRRLLELFVSGKLDEHFK